MELKMKQKKGTILNLPGVFVSAVSFVGLLSFTQSWENGSSRKK